MRQIDRRTFLVNGVRAAAAAAGASAGTVTERAAVAGAAVLAAAHDDSIIDGPLRPSSLTVNGVVNPVGVDPDDCSFAWKLSASGRNALQAAYRITVRRSDPGQPPRQWKSGPVPSGRQAFVLYDGPKLVADAAYAWTVQVKDNTGQWGPESTPGQFVTALRQGDWDAIWLHPASTSQQPDRVTYVRTVMSPPAGKVQRATAFVAAAHTYQLFVNGDRIDAGPSFSYPDEQYFRCIDLTTAIKTGTRNAIGVLHRWYGPGQGRPASFPGLMVQLSLHYANGRRFVHGTDATWREHPAEWLPSPLRNSDGSDFVEWVDGRAHPQGWATAGFDDSSWPHSSVIGPAGTAPFTGTFVQRTRIDDHIVEPVSLRTLANGSVVADFGAVYAARPRVMFAQGEDGRTVPMHVGYLLDPDGQVSTTHGTQNTNLSYSYITRLGGQTFEALTYLGFRYLQIDSPGEALHRDQIAAVATHAAMPDVPMATFSTGQRTLNAVWKLNARSCLYCAHGQFVDTPTREKGQFVWDASNESEAVMGAYGEQNLSWQGLRDVARGQDRYWPDGRINAVYPNGDGRRDIPTFTARFPEWVWRYYVATGDFDSAVLLYPSTSRIADYLWGTRNDITGVLEGLADGDNGDPIFGYDLGVVADTASNVLAINAINRVANLADLAGDATGAATQRSRAAQLTATVNALLTSPEGIYFDGLKSNGAVSTHASQEANALALAYGIVPAANEGSVGAYVASLGISVGPNHGLELLRALGQAERWGDLVRILTDATMPGWAHIVAAGGTFMWETWTPSDLIGDSMSHGWGSSALVAMQESLLGITLMPPSRDGAVRVAITPPRSGLAAARGSVPTVAGPIAVSWSEDRAGFSLQATIPANAAATLVLPAASASSVREAGEAIASSAGVRLDSFANGLAVLTFGSGTFSFTSTPA